MSKKTIKDDDPVISMSFFGTIDTGLFLTYAICQFVSGIIGDNFNKRKVLSISYMIQATLFFVVGLIGYTTFHRAEEGAKDAYQNYLWLFTMTFMGIGLVQSVDLPSLISVMGNWTHRGNRGLVTGLWSTCGSIGNIVGLQLAPYLLIAWEDQWYRLMFVIGCAYIFISIGMFLFLVPDPKEVGIEIEREEAAWLH